MHRLGALVVALVVVVAPIASAVAKTSARPATKVLLRAEGKGPKVTPKFKVTGGSWDLAWSYRCTGPGMFVVSVTGGKRALAPVNQTGVKGSGTTHYASGGTFALTVFTGVCTWTLKATG